MASHDSNPLILHVVHSLEGGGTERTLAALLRAFDHRILRHAVVTLRDAGSLASTLPDEVACIALNIKGSSPLAFLQLANVFARLRPAVIHARNVCTWADAVIARMRTPGTRLLLGFHGLGAGGSFSKRDRRVAKVASACGAQFSTVSRRARDQMSAELEIPQHLITHLPNGVDLYRFRPPTIEQRTAARQTLGIDPQQWAVGVVGSLTPVKGHDLLLAAVALIRQTTRDIRLYIAGDGPLRRSLESQAKSLAVSDCVRFIGQWDDVPAVLHALDAYICPSHSEGTSNALLEAMACGLPVISTSVGDHAMMIRDGVDGLIVPPADTEAMARALNALCSFPQLAREMGTNARARAQQFSFERTVESYENYYHDLCRRPATGYLSSARTCRGMSKSVFDALVSRVDARSPLE